ncbi:hypothetical protein FOG18_00900 [Legionella israelensis]|uniref:hypothetical protein n=1 Tax=Legionella israelensis TaxID=454 RepID=UPI00117C8E03|nr:hypothetical protein [Legionella israelensis]QDP71241.1 hypothetical protein FOG18_00900 [Legionella israelensis]
METETTRELPANEMNESSIFSKIKNAQSTSYLYPIAVSVVTGYFVAPYVSTITRYGFPYFYGSITGTMPEDLGYLEYGSIYIPMREHVTDFAYQNAYAISMTAGLAGYALVKGSYHTTKLVANNAYQAVSSIGRSLFSFFSSQDDNKIEDELDSQPSQRAIKEHP